MNGYVVLSVSLIFFVLLSFVALALWGLFRSLMAAKDTQISNLSTLLNDQRKIAGDLLNRLMADDIKTFQTLNSQNSSKVQSSDYVPQSDEAEILRLHEYYGASGVPVTGLGETAYDDTELANVRDLLGSAP